ncbi:hypothetical protein FKB36_03385 [Methanoculleus sp. Afa-1]|uniref:Nucleotidyltransferase domain-containing protein n=1 Tax=Methanoculleus formosensis TaxID=2590886 RepID=A0A9E4ZK12_9EURY|nr:hypothetical protein [Methanoculleus sp. Afa-1]
MAGRTLTRTAREAIVAILTRNDAEWIAIFGSYARGSSPPRSGVSRGPSQRDRHTRPSGTAQ